MIKYFSYFSLVLEYQFSPYIPTPKEAILLLDGFVQRFFFHFTINFLTVFHYLIIYM